MYEDKKININTTCNKTHKCLILHWENGCFSPEYILQYNACVSENFLWLEIFTLNRKKEKEYHPRGHNGQIIIFDEVNR